MGGGSWDSVSYRSSVTATANLAASTGVDYSKVAFAYSQTEQARTEVHPNLDPRRINNKPFKKLESCDSPEHPNSTAVIMCFDVTGSNYTNAVIAQQKLGNLMDMILKYMPDPQVAIVANDDFSVEPKRCLQFSDFESDNRVDDHLRNVVLVNAGGGNQSESYDLVIYGAARKTKIDCAIKRKRKGYLFMYADEPFTETVTPEEVDYVFGDKIEKRIRTSALIKEARELYHVFVLASNRPLYGSKKQYVDLFGEECVIDLQSPGVICEVVASIIGMKEASLTPDDVVRDLVAVGTPKTVAEAIVRGGGRKIRATA